MEQKNKFGNSCALLATLLLFGCATADEKYFLDTDTKANVYVAPGKSSVQKVAIMPFKAPTELIGSSVSDLFVTEMLRAGKYTLVERSQMTQVLKESEVAMAGLSASGAVEVGNMVGAEAVLIGTVDEYDNVPYRGDTYPTVGLSARLIDCKSGKVIWSVDYAGRAESRRTTLSEQARTVIHGMSAALYKKWRDQE